VHLDLSQTRAQVLFDVSEEEAVLLRLALPFGVPTSRRSSLRKLLARINQTLCFETLVLAEGAGRICCLASVWTNNRLPDERDIDRLIAGALHCVETWLPAIAAVLFGEQDCDAAFESQALILEVRAASDVGKSTTGLRPPWNPAPYTALCRHLEENELAFQAEAPVVTFTTTTDTVTCETFVDFKESESILLEMHLPLRVDPSQAPRVLDLVNRINLHFKFGRFVFDPARGTVLFRHAARAAEPVDDSLFAFLILTALHTVERWFPGFGALLHTHHSAEEIVARQLREEESDPEA
jgi:hypothetical protein